MQQLSEEYMDICDVNTACDIAFREGQSSPKIKQLKWEDWFDDLQAPTKFGYYYIQKQNNSKYMVFSSNFIKHTLDSIDEAKAIAQEDFESRVKGCLEI